ncbi:putative immunity protein [Hymenobacter sp.]|uniref:putative immunity protein n=1 Tax=Hymenobacter sp. TaxID=1898978 RepID=UPI0038D417C8
MRMWKSPTGRLFSMTSPDDIHEHKRLAVWAADCAERVLSLFEQACPDDYRPREAIAAARAWVRNGLTVSEARQCAFAAHAAARDAQNPAAVAAARAAGHAAATAHVATHARHAEAYARRAVASQ